jgi:AcrR family transcriptional regulator
MTERSDPRIARTDRALESAILELAARRPVSTITVADLTEAAGISRATFYNRHDSPLELLIGVLTAIWSVAIGARSSGAHRQRVRRRARRPRRRCA